MSAAMEWYRSLMRRSDPRTINWFLMSDFTPLFAILISYNLFSIYIGPWIMKNREPFSLRKILALYNFIQIALSLYILHEAIFSAWLAGHSIRCQPIDYSNSPTALRVASGMHFYFLTRLLELLDTIFFVFRKNNRQITFLHLYHHTIMAIAAWIGSKYTPGGVPIFMGTINVIVHIIMYSYYMLSSLGPEAKKHLWWKKYVTMLQLLQFCLIAVHCANTLIIDCDYPKVLTFLIMVNALMFIRMFGSFYIANYVKNVKKELRNGKQLVTKVTLDVKLD